MATYGELHAHSGFSFLDGASDPEELVVEATRLGLSGLALCDHHGLYGVVRFAEAARALGLRDASLAPRSPSRRTTIASGSRTPRASTWCCLARSPAGYAALSRMLALAHLERGEKGAPRFTLDQVASAAREWLVLTGCRKGPLTRALMDEGPRAARARLAATRRALRSRERRGRDLGPRRARRRRAQRRRWPSSRCAADVAVVATNNVHYATPRDFPRANVLSAIRARQSLEEMEGWLSASPLAHLRSDAEQRRRFARWPGVVDRAGELAGELAFDLRLVAPNLPAFRDARGAWTSSPT